MIEFPNILHVRLSVAPGNQGPSAWSWYGDGVKMKVGVSTEAAALAEFRCRLYKHAVTFNCV